MTHSQRMARAEALARILSDLDRCEHGRHRADPCFDCPGGWSAGNAAFPPPGSVIGHDLTGGRYVVPAEGRSFGDPQAWRPS